MNACVAGTSLSAWSVHFSTLQWASPSALPKTEINASQVGKNQRGVLSEPQKRSAPMQFCSSGPVSPAWQNLWGNLCVVCGRVEQPGEWIPEIQCAQQRSMTWNVKWSCLFQCNRREKVKPPDLPIKPSRSGRGRQEKHFHGLVESCLRPRCGNATGSPTYITLSARTLSQTGLSQGDPLLHFLYIWTSNPNCWWPLLTK